MNDFILKQETLDKFIGEHFNLEGDLGKHLTAQNIPNYVHTLNNFQDFLVTMDRKDWSKSIQIKKSQYFMGQTQAEGMKQVSADGKITPARFEEVANMHAFVQGNAAKLRDQNQERIRSLKVKINNLINELYDTILQATFKYDSHRVPFHGIAQPQFENPVNLF